MTSSASPLDQLVTFNVGGKIFLVSKETLLRHKNEQTESYLTALVDPYWNTSSVVTIDRSPVLFEAVIDFLRYSRWRFPSDVSPSDVFEEMTFFGYIVPQCSATLAWHRARQAHLKTANDVRAADPTFISKLIAVVTRALEGGEDQFYVAPSEEYIAGQLQGKGLSGLKLKIADLMQSFLAGSIIDSSLFDGLRTPDGRRFISFIAHTRFFESSVEIEDRPLSLQVVTRQGSIANDYRLVPYDSKSADGSVLRPAGASILVVRPKIATDAMLHSGL